MNNIVNNPKTLSRLWAALSCDFESLLSKFMASKGWRYIHFAAICRQMDITLVMHITQGRGKTKDEHYYRITDMIFQLCKDLWLRSVNVVDNNEAKSDVDIAMELKRSLGGFFLLYTMYEKQPCRGRMKISLGIDDMVSLGQFYKSITPLPYAFEVVFMMQHLYINNAFHYCINSQEYRFEASCRNFLNISQSEVVQLTKKMRDAQDVLAYSSVHSAAEEKFQSLSAMKNDLAKDMMKTVDDNKVRMHFHPDNQSVFSFYVHAVNSESLLVAMTKLDELLDQPIMTLQALTATEAIEKRIKMETIRRMERARKKAMLQTNFRDGEPKAVRPYVREGGIFGRKKETEEGDDKTKRRERGACNGNLWIFINGLDFDKPSGERGSPLKTEQADEDLGANGDEDDYEYMQEDD